MKILEKIRAKIRTRFAATPLGDNRGRILLMRRTLLKTRLLSIYHHSFVNGDTERCLHDHPWSFLVIILRGGYWEEMANGRHWRRAGSILWRPAETAHRIDLEPGIEPVSLVFVGPKIRDWGFHALGGWRPWGRNTTDPACPGQN